MPHAEHLQMIQAVVERMARNSFLLKSWTVALVAALIGLSAEKSNSDFAIIAAGVAVIFWGLDAYYLAAERKFRNLYDDAIAGDGKVPTWSLSAEKVGAADFGRGLFSATVLPIHGSVVAGALAVALLA